MQCNDGVLHQFKYPGTACLFGLCFSAFGSAEALAQTGCQHAPKYVQIQHNITADNAVMKALKDGLIYGCDDASPIEELVANLGQNLSLHAIRLMNSSYLDGQTGDVITLQIQTDADAPNRPSYSQSLVLPITLASASASSSDQPIQQLTLDGEAVENEELVVRYIVDENWLRAQKGQLRLNWLRDGVIMDAPSRTRYRLRAEDVGRSISAELLVVDDAGNVITALETNPTNLVAMAEHPPEIKELMLAGEAIVGTELRVEYIFSDRNPEDAEADTRFIWLRDNLAIAGADKPSYQITDDDIGSRITVRVIPRSTDGLSGEAVMSTLAGRVEPKLVVLAPELDLASRLPAPPVAKPAKPRQTDQPQAKPVPSDQPDLSAPKEGEGQTELAQKEAPKPSVQLAEGLSMAWDSPTSLQKIDFTASGILSTDELAAIQAQFEKQEITLELVRGVLEATNQLFAEKGYELSRALLPQQMIEGGVLRIQLVDAKIGSINLENRQRVRAEFILKQLGLEPGDFISLAELETTIRRFNANNRTQLTTELAPGEGFGETDIFVNVAEAPRVELPTVSVNNHASQLSDWRESSFTTTFHNLYGRDDELSLTFSDSEGSDSRGLQFSIPINTLGTNLTLARNEAKTKVKSGPDTTVGYRGSSHSTSISLSHPLIFNDDYSIYASASYGSSYGDLVQPGDGLLLSRSRTRRYSFGLPMSWSNGLTTLSFAPSFTVLNTLTEIPRNERWMSKLDGSFALSQFVDERFTVNVKGNFLYSDARDMINLPSEILSIGGASSVRAYQPGEASGYQGYFLSAELRTDLANWSGVTLPDVMPSVQPYVFVDHAMAQAQYKKRTRADYWSGAGAGVTVPTFLTWLTLDAYWAVPLDGDIHKAEKEAYDDDLIQFSLGARFTLN